MGLNIENTTKENKNSSAEVRFLKPKKKLSISDFGIKTLSKDDLDKRRIKAYSYAF